MLRPVHNHLRTVSLSVSASLLVALAGPPAVLAKSSPWDGYINQGKQEMETGHYDEAARLLQQALDASKSFASNDVRLGTTYHAMGNLALRQRDYSLAKEYFERALYVEQAQLGPDNLEVADSLYGLALAYEQRGDHKSAELYLRRVIEIWTKQYGPNSDKLTAVLPAIATYASLAGDFPRAEKYFRQLVSIQEQTLGADSPRLAWSLNLLASALANTRRYSEAEPLAQRSVDILSHASDQAIALDSALMNLRFIKRQLGQPVPDVGTFPGESRYVEPPEERQSQPEPSQSQRPQPSTPLAMTTSKPPIAATPPVTKTPTPAQPATPPVVSQATPPAVPTPAPTQPPVTSGKTPPAQTTAAPAENQEPTKLAMHTPTAQPPIATSSGDFRPWETTAFNPQTAAAGTKSASWGKVRYMSAGRIISEEEYKAMMLANQAYELIREEKYKMAADILNRALAVCPTLSSAHTNLGLALSRIGQTEDAIEHLKDAIAIDPSRSAPWVNLASAFQLNGQLKACVVTYREYMRRFPDDQMVSKVKDLADNLQKEQAKQEAIERAMAAAHDPGTSDYYHYVSHDGNVRWDEKRLPLKVYINSGRGVPGYKLEYQGFFDDSFKEWSTATASKVTYELVKDADKADVECIWSNDIKQVSSPSEGGECQSTYNKAGMEHARIVVLTCDPSPDSPLSPNQLKAVCLHEIGHALGMHGHSPRPTDIMYCSMPMKDAKVVLTPRDAQTLLRVYAAAINVAGGSPNQPVTGADGPGKCAIVSTPQAPSR